MAIAAFSDNGVFGDPYPFDLGDRMTSETVASAIGHFRRVGRMAFDTGCHRFMPFVGIDIFEQEGMTGHTIPRTPPKRQQ